MNFIFFVEQYMLRRIVGTVCVIVNTSDCAAVHQMEVGVIKDEMEILSEEYFGAKGVLFIWSLGCGPKKIKEMEDLDYHQLLEQHVIPREMEAMRSAIDLYEYDDGGIECIFRSGGITYTPQIGRIYVNEQSAGKLYKDWNFKVCYDLYKKSLDSFTGNLNERRLYTVPTVGDGDTYVYRTGCSTLTIRNRHCKLSVLSSIGIDEAQMRRVDEIYPCVTAEELKAESNPVSVRWTSTGGKQNSRILNCLENGETFAQYTWKPTIWGFTPNYARFCEILHGRVALIQDKLNGPFADGWV